MPVIYSPKLSEVYRTTFFTIPSTFPGFISTGEVLVADGQGATVWEQITGTNIPIQTAYVAQTTSTNQLYTNYISAGSVNLNSVNVPQINTDTISAGIITAEIFTTQSLSTNTLTAYTLTALEYLGSTLQTSHISTTQFQTTLLNVPHVTANLISSGAVYTTHTESVSTLANMISTTQYNTTTANFNSTNVSSTSFITLESEFISAGMITAPFTSTQLTSVSSINGQKYPIGPLITPTPQFSTVSIQNTVSSISTLADTVSTGILVTPLATLSSLTTTELYARSGTIPYADFGSTSTATMYTVSTHTKYIQSGQFNTNTVSTTSITAQITNAQTVSTNTLITDTLTLSTALATQVYAETISTAAATFITLQTNSLSTQLLSTGLASFLDASISSLQLNTLSSGVVIVPSTFISVAMATSQLTSITARVNTVSGGTILAQQTSTTAAFVSTLNGAPYPVIFSVNPDLQLSTILVYDTMTTQSTFTTILSTGTLDASLRASTVNTNTISTGTVNARTATFTTATIESLRMNTLSNTETVAESTIVYGPTQVSTLFAESANLSTLSTGVTTTSQIDARYLIQTNSLFINTLSTATFEASNVSVKSVITNTVQSGITTVSTCIGKELSVTNISTSQVVGDSFVTSALSTNTLGGQVLIITDTAAINSLSTFAISTGTTATVSIYTNTLFVSTLSTASAVMSTASATTAMIEFLSVPTARYPQSFNLLTLSVSSISSAVAEFDFIDVSELTAGSFTFVSATTEIGYIDTISTINATFSSIYMNNDGAYTYANTVAASSISVTKLNFQYAVMSSIEAITATSQMDTHTLANTNLFKVDALVTESVNINSVLAGSASTNMISTVYSEGGYVQFGTLETNKAQAPSTFAAIVSTGHLTADTISTHTITIWGPNTLLVQGNTILDGAAEQSGDFFIQTLQTSTLSFIQVTGISSIDIVSAQISSTTTEEIIGSTLRVSTIDTTNTEAAQLVGQTMLTSTVNANQISTINFTVEAVYGSTLTLNTFTTVSSITQTDVLTVAELTADYLGINETLSTTSAEINTLDVLNLVTTSVSTAILSTGLMEFGSLSLQNIQTNTLSTGVISTTTAATFQTVLATNLRAIEGNPRVVRAIDLSTGIYTTDFARISTFVTNSLSTGILSTGVLEATSAIFETLSTNRLFLSSVYAQNVTALSVNTDYISAGSVTIQGNLLTQYLNTNTFTYITSEFGNNLTATSVSTNKISTSLIFGRGILAAQGISTNIISAQQLNISTASVSSFFTYNFSAGQLLLSTFAISSLSTSLVEANRFVSPTLIRTTTTNADKLSTATVFGTLLDARVNALSSAAVSTNSVNFISANVTFLSTVNISISSLLTAEQAIFASTFIRQLSVGIITPTFNFIVSSLSTNFISSANISSAIANIDSLSTFGISTQFLSGNTAFINAISTGFLRAGRITAQSSTYGDLRVSSINGVNIAGGYVIPASGGTVTNMIIKEVSQSATLSTTFLSTQYMEVRGQTNLNISPPFRGWVTGLLNTGTNSAQRIRFTPNSELTNTTTWYNASTLNIPATNITYGLAYNGDHILALRNTADANQPLSSMLLSYDASNWVPIKSGGFTSNAYAAKWNGNMWVAVGTSNPTADDPNPRSYIQHSYDGFNWISSVTVPPKMINFHDVQWNGSLWLACGGTFNNTGGLTNIVYSSDGSNWTRVDGTKDTPTGPWRSGRFSGGVEGAFSLAWAPSLGTQGIWAGVGSGSGGCNSAQLQYSDDGGTFWKYSSTVQSLGLNTTTGEQSKMYTVKWNGTRFLAAGQFSSFVTSTDGSNWTSRSSSGGTLTAPVIALEWYDNTWIATRSTSTEANRIMKSTDDGVTWTNIGAGFENAPGPILAIFSTTQGRADLAAGNIEFYTRGIPVYNKTHQIYISTDRIQIDRFAIITRSTNQFIINTNLYQNSTAALIVNSTIYCSGDAYKPTGGEWVSPSDRSIKQDIQLANYSQCYNTLKNIPLYHYTYIDSYKAATHLRDQSVLGFIAQEVSNYFPKAVDTISAYGFSDLLTLDQDQLLATHYGATRHLITMNEKHRREISSFYTSTLGNMPHYISSIPQTFVTLEEEYSQISTMMAVEAGQRYATYESTIASHFIIISTLTSKYDVVYSMASTLNAQRAAAAEQAAAEQAAAEQAATETEQVPSQPPQEGV